MAAVMEPGQRIPKIIHFCWLSDDPYPEDVRRCMATWKAKCPDYEVVHWDFKRFPRGTSRWVDEAFDAGKFAFAADYIRLYALKNYGGIYLDTDVEAVKSFDELLRCPYFIGYESGDEGIEAAVLGFERDHPLIDAVLRSYEGRPFVRADGSHDDLTLPKRFNWCITEGFARKPISSVREFDESRDVVCVFPSSWFSPKDFITQRISQTPNTYAIHHFAGSWLSPGRRCYLFFRRLAERIVGGRVMGFLKRIKRSRCKCGFR